MQSHASSETSTPSPPSGAGRIVKLKGEKVALRITPAADAWATRAVQICVESHFSPSSDASWASLSQAVGASQSGSSTASSSHATAMAQLGAAPIECHGVQLRTSETTPTSPVVEGKIVGTSTAAAPTKAALRTPCHGKGESHDISPLRGALKDAASVVQGAYRLNLPCFCQHSTTESRQANCTASPRCMAGLQAMSCDAAALDSCVRAVMGDGPGLMALPHRFHKDEREGNGIGSGGGGAGYCRMKKRGKELRREDDDGAGEGVSPVAPATAAEKEATDGTAACWQAVAEDDSFPCLWRGVRNLSNTCYFSSILQLLFSVARLRQSILHVDGTAMDTMGGPAAAIDVDAVVEVPSGDQLPESGLRELFTMMAFSRCGDGADPRSFAKYLSLDVAVQQDAQEFFTLLLDWLRCHCGPVVEAAIANTFSGTLLYDRRCERCGRSTKRAEPFLYLSLPIRSALEDSIAAWLQPDQVDGFMCEGCRSTAAATSRQYLRTLPDVLVLHLNRFEFDIRTLQRQKVGSTVSFPLDLDMTSHVRQWNEAKGSATAATSGDAAEYEYELRGVVNHIGDSALSGHYTYHGKVPRGNCGSSGGRGDHAAAAEEAAEDTDVWMNFNDAEVSKLHRYRGQRGSSADAYMLVYHRVRLPTPTDTAMTMTTTAAAVEEERRRSLVAAVLKISTTSAPTGKSFPLFLRRYADRMNAAAVERRQRWLKERSAARKAAGLWADAAEAIFATAAPSTTSPTLPANSTSTGCYLIPTSWLQHFGRLFLPPYLDVVSLGGSGGEKGATRKRQKAEEVEEVPLSSLPHPFDSNPPTATAAAASSADGEGPAPVTGTVVGPMMESVARLAAHAADVPGESGNSFLRLLLQHPLKDTRASIACPHGRLAPWGAYKLISAAAFARLEAFLASYSVSCGDATGSPDAPAVPATSYDGFFFTPENICECCVGAMAAMVEHLSSTAAEDAAAVKKIAEYRNASPPPPSAMATSSTATADAAAGEEEVYISCDVLDTVESLMRAQERWHPVIKTEGFTGMLTMLTSKCSPPPAQSDAPAASLPNPASSPSQLSGDEEEGLPSAGQLLCPHGALRFADDFVVVPASLRQYWLRRLPPLWAALARVGYGRRDPVDFCSGGRRLHLSALDAGQVEAVLLQLLPYLPVATTQRSCESCARSLLQGVSTRNYQRILKMEEAKRYPTLWIAGKMTSATGMSELLLEIGAESEEQLLLSHHPNRLFFKQPCERQYRDYMKRWKDAHQRRLEAREAEVRRLTTVAERQRAQDAAWLARVSQQRRGGGRGARVVSSSDVVTPNSPEGRLAAAEAALARLKAQTIPDYTTKYGCVPTWWVARWYAALQEASSPTTQSATEMSSGGGMAALPPIAYDEFKCQHGATLLEASWLNPADKFWQGAKGKRPEVLWNPNREARRTAAGPTAVASTPSPAPGTKAMAPGGPGPDDYRPQCWLPPLLIVPMEEYLPLLEQYGTADMLRKATMPLSTAAKQPASDEDDCQEVINEATAAKDRSRSTIPSASVPRDTADSRAAVISEPGATATPPPLPTKIDVAYEPVGEQVVQVIERRGERQLWPPACPTCCAAVVEGFDDSSDFFIHGSLKLVLHIRKSRRNFYDAMSLLTSEPSPPRDATTTATTASSEEVVEAPNGVNYYTTLGQLRVLISHHIMAEHGLIVPADVLQVFRGRGKVLKRQRPRPSLLYQQQHSAIPEAVDVDADAATLEAEATNDAVDLYDLTLFELGITDGETISVQSPDVVAQPCARATAAYGSRMPTSLNGDKGEAEEWEAIPPELLNTDAANAVMYENTAAFRDTRLQGHHTTTTTTSATSAKAAATAAMGGLPATRGSSDRAAVSPSSEACGAACSVCTFLNAPGMVICEMCEAPLPPK